MKKTMLVLALGMLFGAVNATAAVPTIDGSFSGAEWANIQPYPAYLNVSSVNDALIPDAYDIKTVVLLQNLTLADGPKGVYLGVETYATPSLTDLLIGPPPAQVSLIADWNGNNALDAAGGGFPADVQVLIYRAGGIDVVEACTGPVTCVPGGGFVIFTDDAVANDLPGVEYARGANSIELFLPSTSLGTPPDTVLPASFIGTIIYDNGGTAPDDVIQGSVTLIPEPSTVMLLGAGLLGLIGYRRFKA